MFFLGLTEDRLLEVLKMIAKTYCCQLLTVEVYDGGRVFVFVSAKTSGVYSRYYLWEPPKTCLADLLVSLSGLFHSFCADTC